MIRRHGFSRCDDVQNMDSLAAASTALCEYCPLENEDHEYIPYPRTHGVYPSPNSFAGFIEMKKEKSRDAARSRRGKENYEFFELATLLPLPTVIASQLDKASIVRLTIAYMKLRDFARHGEPSWPEDTLTYSQKTAPNNKDKSFSPAQEVSGPTQEMFNLYHGRHILQAMDGFIFALDTGGRFLYVSETVSIYLGLSQVEMTGNSIFDYVHRGDYEELAEKMGLSLKSASLQYDTSSSSDFEEQNEEEEQEERINKERSFKSMSEESTLNGGVDEFSMTSHTTSRDPTHRSVFCVRMKSTLTKRGVLVKSSGYRVIQIVANMRLSSQVEHSTSFLPPHVLGVTAMAIPLPSLTVSELSLDNYTFVMRLGPQFNIIYCERRMCDILDFSVDDMKYNSLYDFCHPEDLRQLQTTHEDVMKKGQSVTDYYRLINNSGGFIWVQTSLSIIYNNKHTDEYSLMAIHYILSAPGESHTVSEHLHRTVDTPDLTMSKGTPVQAVDVKTFSQPKTVPITETLKWRKTENNVSTVSNFSQNGINNSITHNNELMTSGEDDSTATKSVHCIKPNSHSTIATQNGSTACNSKRLIKNLRRSQSDVEDQVIKRKRSNNSYHQSKNNNVKTDLQKLSSSPEDLTIRSHSPPVSISYYSSIRQLESHHLRKKVQSTAFHEQTDKMLQPICNQTSHRYDSIISPCCSKSHNTDDNNATKFVLNSPTVPLLESTGSLPNICQFIQTNAYYFPEGCYNPTNAIQRLQEAMLKHLPIANHPNRRDCENKSPGSQCFVGVCTDCSTDQIERSQSRFLSRSTAHLPATNLLRSLHANHQHINRTKIFCEVPRKNCRSLILNNCNGIKSALNVDDSHYVMTPPSSVSPDSKRSSQMTLDSEISGEILQRHWCWQDNHYSRNISYQSGYGTSAAHETEGSNKESSTCKESSSSKESSPSKAHCSDFGRSFGTAAYDTCTNSLYHDSHCNAPRKQVYLW